MLQLEQVQNVEVNSIWGKSQSRSTSTSPRQRGHVIFPCVTNSLRVCLTSPKEQQGTARRVKRSPSVSDIHQLSAQSAQAACHSLAFTRGTKPSTSKGTKATRTVFLKISPVSGACDPRH